MSDLRETVLPIAPRRLDPVALPSRVLKETPVKRLCSTSGSGTYFALIHSI